MSRFLQQAWLGRSGWSPYLMTLLALVVGAFVVGSIGVVVLVWLLSGSFPVEPGAATPEAFGLTNLQFFGVNMLPFVVLLGVLAVCLPVFHRRLVALHRYPNRTSRLGTLGHGHSGVDGAYAGHAWCGDAGCTRRVEHHV